MLRRNLFFSSSSSSSFGVCTLLSSRSFSDAASSPRQTMDAPKPKDPNEPEKPKTANFQSYVAHKNFKDLRNGLLHGMSEIQLEEHTKRENLALNSGQSIADPIWMQGQYGKSLSSSKGEMDSYMNKDSAAQWMRVTDAAKLLGIPKDKVPGIKQQIIEEYFTIAYTRAQNNSEKDFIVAAAELLIEYTKSSFAADVTRARKLQLIQKMREDLDKENKEWHNQLFEKLAYGMGSYVTVAMTIFGFAIIIFFFYSRSGHLFSAENNLTVESMGRFVRKSMSYDPNMEATPDYTNRYKNTPTAYDMMQKEGHVEIGDPNTRKAMIEKDQRDNKEKTLMAILMRDSKEIEDKARLVEKNETRRQEEPVGPKLLKEMMENRIDAEWWEKAKKLQAIYRDGNFISKW